VLEEALKNDVHIETSSAFDIPIVRTLYERGKISKETFIICNGFKMPQYRQYITELLNEEFNCIPILDNLSEIDTYESNVTALTR
jgi:arginine decarboxylase